MKNLVLLVLSLAVLSSCSPNLSFYTEDLHNSLGFSESEMQQIQFFLSDELILERAADLEQAEIRDGRITLSKDREVERVRIPARTPGVMVFSPDGKRIAISFDDNDNEFLMFGPNPRMRGQYMLFASEWVRNSAVVTYGGKKYRTQPGAGSIGLMVELKALEKQRVNARTARGRQP